MTTKIWTSRIWASAGASVLALYLMSGGAEARKVSYEIDGRQYTYDTNDPHQVESARKRIEAANAADAARAKAEAEKAAMPLVSVFGSPAQKEAAQAKARLEQVLAEQEAADAARKQERSAAKETQSRRQSEDEARAPDPEPDGAAEKSKSAALDKPQPANVTRMEPPVEVPVSDTKPMVKSVSFDMESGIKTTIMSDGTIQEEPFDSNMLSKLAFEQDGTGTLTDFVNQIRKVSPEDTTGSTTRADARAPASSQP